MKHLKPFNEASVQEMIEISEYVKELFTDITDTYSDVVVDMLPRPFNIGMSGDRYMVLVKVGKILIKHENLQAISEYNQKLISIFNDTLTAMNRMKDDGYEITTYALFPSSYSEYIVIEIKKD
jgi:hypothetical protein